MRKPVVFLSYSSKDKEVIKVIADKLTLNGIRVWLDKWEIKGGDSITKAIEHGIGSCDVFIASFSPAFVNSRWCREELSAALIRLIEDKARLIPILLDDCEIPLLLRDKLYRDLRELKELTLLISDITGKKQNLNPRDHVEKVLLAKASTVSNATSANSLISKTSIYDRRSYVREVLSLIKDEKEVSVACMDGVLPYVLYGDTETTFRELRQMECEERPTMMGLTPEVVTYWEGFWDKYRAGTIFRYAISPASVELLEHIILHRLDHSRAREVLQRFEIDISLYSVDIRLVRQTSAYCTFISPTRVLFALISPRVSGLVSEDTDLIVVHQQEFDLHFSAGSSFQSWLRNVRDQLNKRKVSQ